MTSAPTTAVEDSVPEPVRPIVAVARVGRTISEALAGHQNSLGFIRLVLASIVIFDHAFPLGSFGADPFFALSRGQASLGSIAVDGFFAISGYLIAKSAMSADIVQYMWRRFLRIFPAYWAVLIVTAFVVIPIVWIAQGQSLATYFHVSGPGPVRFVVGNWTLNIGTYGIYDVFAKTTPYGHLIGGSAVNGSIWTLIYEWNCYLLIAGLLVFGVLKRAKVVVPIITAFLFIVQVVLFVNPTSIPKFIPWLTDQYTIMLTLTFMLGSCVAIYSKRIPYSNGLGILSAVLFLYTFREGGFQEIGVPAGVYLVLYLGARLPRVIQRIGTKNDYSYGVYVYGFLVEQVLARVGLYKLGYFPFAIGTLIVSVGMAWLSWHMIEKRAMSLKDWGPGRGLRYWWDWSQSRRSKRAEVAEVSE
jgi:peptidoglycan/LPS O-acetylase OafA/YrhL